MNDGQSLIARYQAQTRRLLVERALGLLSQEDEAEIAEALDDVWRELSPQQREDVEQWLSLELQPAPPAGDHDEPLIQVESGDIRVSPRSAA